LLTPSLVIYIIEHHHHYHQIDPNRAASMYGLFADFLASNKGYINIHIYMYSFTLLFRCNNQFLTNLTIKILPILIGLLTKKAFAARETTDSKKENSNDPAVRLGAYLYMIRTYISERILVHTMILLCSYIDRHLLMCVYLNITIGNSNSFIDIYAYYILAFTSRLDRETCAILDSQVIVQQFYECRIASLERYIGIYIYLCIYT
jgi:hypothetical protein